MSESKRTTRHRLLEGLLALHPAGFRQRFAEEITHTFDDLLQDSPHEARRFLLDLARNVPGTHFDAWRLARRPPVVPPRPETSMLESLARDLDYARRRLQRQPVVTLLAALTLALGIGGTAVIFSVIDGVLLSPLSAPEPERLVTVFETTDSDRSIALSYETFRDYERLSNSFEHLAASRAQSVTVHDDIGSPERIRGLFISSGFFDVLGEGPILGRSIAPGEDVPDGERTAVLSYGFWQRRYGGDEKVLGRTVKLNNEPHTIVGVMGSDFRYPYDTTEAWLSLQTFPGSLNRENRTLFITGRLASGVSLEVARQELRGVAAGLEASFPGLHHGVSASADPLLEVLTGSDATNFLAILAAAVAMVLLIATANVANLQLAQATGRVREMSLRAALGAGRRRLAIQLLIESSLLAALGGFFGLAVAHGGIGLLNRVGPGRFTRLHVIDLDLRVLAFAAVVSLLTGIVFGLLPARRASRVDLVDGLQGTSRTGSGSQGQHLRSALVVAQVALAVLLVTAAGLLLRSLQNLNALELGFDTEQLMTVQFRLPANKYADGEQVVRFFDDMLERVEALPGIEGAAAALGMPFTGDEGRYPILVDGVDPGPSVEVPQVRCNIVSTDYFQVLGIPLLSGRSFEATDEASASLVAVVSEQASERLWPGRSPLGETFSLRGEERLYTVVGVVGDIYNRGLRRGVDPLIYSHHPQSPALFATVAARTTGDPHAAAPAIQEAIWQVDPEQPLWEVMTQEERIAQWQGSDRFMSSLVSIFALLALLLAAVGIGGVVAYSVALRRRELGVRLSLGARREQILGLVLGQGLRLVLLGLALGLLGTLGLHQVLSSLLFGVSPFEPSVFLAVPLTLGIVALLATLGPAWHAARLDPVRTLREE